MSSIISALIKSWYNGGDAGYILTLRRFWWAFQVVPTWPRLGELLRMSGGGGVRVENTQRQSVLLQMDSREFGDDRWCFSLMTPYILLKTDHMEWPLKKPPCDLGRDLTQTKEEQCGCGREGQGADAGRWGEECPARLGKVDKSQPRPGENQTVGEPPESQKWAAWGETRVSRRI